MDSKITRPYRKYLYRRRPSTGYRSTARGDPAPHSQGTMASRLMLVLILLALPVLPEALIQFDFFLSRAKSFLQSVKAGFKAYDYIQKADDYSQQPGNTRAITSPEGFTLIWPTDDAISRLSPITLQSLTDEDKQQIIYAHTVPSYITFPLASSSPITLKTLVPGVTITIYGDASPYYVSSALRTSRVLAY